MNNGAMSFRVATLALTNTSGMDFMVIMISESWMRIQYSRTRRVEPLVSLLTPAIADPNKRATS